MKDEWCLPGPKTTEVYCEPGVEKNDTEFYQTQSIYKPSDFQSRHVLSVRALPDTDAGDWLYWEYSNWNSAISQLILIELGFCLFLLVSSGTMVFHLKLCLKFEKTSPMMICMIVFRFCTLRDCTIYQENRSGIVNSFGRGQEHEYAPRWNTGCKCWDCNGYVMINALV